MEIAKYLTNCIAPKPSQFTIDYSTSTDYYISKPIFNQPIDYQKCKYRISLIAQKLLSYLMGAINHYRSLEIFKSYSELKEEAGFTRYGLDMALKELSNLGLISRQCKNFKNKSHWKLNIAKFFDLKLSTFSKKLNLILRTIFIHLAKSANSSNTRFKKLLKYKYILSKCLKSSINYTIKKIFDFVYQFYKFLYWPFYYLENGEGNLMNFTEEELWKIGIDPKLNPRINAQQNQKVVYSSLEKQKKFTPTYAQPKYFSEQKLNQRTQQNNVELSPEQKEFLKRPEFVGLSGYELFRKGMEILRFKLANK